VAVRRVAVPGLAAAPELRSKQGGPPSPGRAARVTRTCRTFRELAGHAETPSVDTLTQ